MTSAAHKRIYKAVIKVLEGQPETHKGLIEQTIKRLYDGVKTNGQVGEFTEVRGTVSEVIAEMKRDGVILYDSGTYSLGAIGAMPLRLEKCENEIVTLLSSGEKTKQEIRSYLRRVFKTDKTESDSDDRILFNYMGQILRRLSEKGTVEFKEGKYSLRAATKADVGDIAQMAKLKSDFLSRIHGKGGEFFEHYIMTLLRKNEEAYGKKISECKIMGGSIDGGIDGIMKTTDHLGFRETLLIQAKNRTDLTNETTVRGFLGAICAGGGDKGIFATTSDFHPSAKIFLNSVNNLVGINGDDIFAIACERLYGIKKKSGKLVIDNKII